MAEFVFEKIPLNGVKRWNFCGRTFLVWCFVFIHWNSNNNSFKEKICRLERFRSSGSWKILRSRETRENFKVLTFLRRFFTTTKKSFLLDCILFGRIERCSFARIWHLTVILKWPVELRAFKFGYSWEYASTR